MSKASQALKVLADLRHLPLHGLRFRLIDADGQASDFVAAASSIMPPMISLSAPPQIVGHLASQIAGLLQGKDKPLYSPKKNLGDVVIVINAAHVHFTHDTWTQKLYRWHTGERICLSMRPCGGWEPMHTTALVSPGPKPKPPLTLQVHLCYFVGLPGGLKERTAIDQWDRDPTKILKDAVKGMLPKNKTQVYRLEKLKIFPEAEHPFTDFDLVSCSPK